MKEEVQNNNKNSYTQQILSWLGLIALTALLVTFSGIKLGGFSLFVFFIIIALQSILVINKFMLIKCQQKIFKVFLTFLGCALIVVLIMSFVLN
ncbi:MAG: hypothetical protein JEY94_14670 [Melioribacteraceae bacterium]|nr:hypothetical protein [Melioribacteraceae bacterium]